MNRRPAIITLSHLRWDFVHQRPQHLMTGLSGNYRIFFVEEPVFGENREPEWRIEERGPGLTVCRPVTPSQAPGFEEQQLPHLAKLLPRLIEEQSIEDYILWFYTPMPLPATDMLSPRAVVYDCMDELSAFLGAPPELMEREKALLARADLVFTGGPSLYRSKQNRHQSVHCFSSSVDAKHFAAAANGMTEAPDQADLPHPRLGFFGVIDERMDLPLLSALASSHPEWQIAMVGPVVKIDSAALPQHPNIRYYGQRSYAQLPSYLKGWDVCLMPFARNKSTQFISPTKTLEYMAAEKMIVSTPITDVAEPYGDIVYLGGTPAEFIRACERALEASPEERAQKKAAMRKVLSETSWASTVNRMGILLDETVQTKRNRATEATGKAARNVVIGAGPTGLSAAYHLGEDSLLIERNDSVGGWCRSIEKDGFTFDYAGHIMFSADPYVHQLYKMLLGENVHWQEREAWIYSKNTYTRYPFQASLYGLPPQVIKECIVGAIESRFGALKQRSDPKPNGSASGHANGHANGNANGHANRNANGHANGNANGRANGNANGHANGNANGHANAHANGHQSVQNGAQCGTDLKDCCADGILEASAPLGQPVKAQTSAEPRNFEEFIYKVWGSGIAKHFAIPYNRKLWAVPLNEMETSWLGGRVPLPDLEEIIEGALVPSPKPMGPNARFGYPLRGGFQALMDAWLPHLKGDLMMGTGVSRVTPSRHVLTLNDGSEVQYRNLISTMPLPVLVSQIGSEAPEAIRRAAQKLRYVSVRCVHIGVARENVTEKHWIYYPEDTVFHRIFVQGNASPFCNPAGGFGLTCEITYSPQKPLPCDGDDLIRRCIDDCRKVGIIDAADPILTSAQCDLPHAYVVYDHERADAVKTIRNWLAGHDIFLAGRYSEWEYYNSDHAFLAGKKAAEQVREAERLQLEQGQPAVISIPPTSATVS